jgi:hypothetical protein
MFDRRVAKTGGYPRVKNSSKSPEVGSNPHRGWRGAGDHIYLIARAAH